MFPFLDELCLFSHLGFTYTTYITVKRGVPLLFPFLSLLKYFIYYNSISNIFYLSILILNEIEFYL